MNYTEALEYIHGVNWRGSRLGLSRIQELLALLGNPQDQLKFVHVAGTNGKGSTCAMLASIFEKSGIRTGLYTSPYIRRFNERIQVNSESIGDTQLAEITEHIKPYAESMSDHPTEFEFVTAVAMEYFKREKCDIVILEVGLGGTLDSTNVINTPEVAVITAIDFDHMKELGGTIESIASAKAGIIKQNGSVVFYGNNVTAEKVIADKCAVEKAALTIVDYSTLNIRESSIEGTTFDFHTRKMLFVPLPGIYQARNAALVLTAIDILSEKFQISEEAVHAGLAEVKWPGRFELLCKKPVFIADGAHNPHGIRGTADSIAHHFSGKKVLLVMGVMADKDVEQMLDIILPYAKQVFAVTPANPRALPAQDLAEKISTRGISAEAYEKVEDGVRAAISAAAPDDVICSLGSLYMYGDVADAIEQYAP